MTSNPPRAAGAHGTPRSHILLSAARPAVPRPCHPPSPPSAVSALDVCLDAGAAFLGLPSCTLVCGPHSPPPRLLPTQARPLAVRLVQACLRGGPGWQPSLGTRERPTCASGPPGPVPPCPVVITPRSGVQAQRGRAPAHQVPRTGGRWSRHWSLTSPCDMCNFSQTAVCEGGFASFWTRPAETDRPLWPRRAAPAEGGSLTPAGRRRAHRWAGGRGRASAGALPGHCSSSRLGPCAEGSGEEPRGMWRGQDTRGPRGHQALAPWVVSGPCPQRRGRGRGMQEAGTAGNQTAPAAGRGPWRWPAGTRPPV